MRFLTPPGKVTATDTPICLTVSDMTEPDQQQEQPAQTAGEENHEDVAVFCGDHAEAPQNPETDSQDS